MSEEVVVILYDMLEYKCLVYNKRRFKLAFLPLGQLPSIYILLVYNTYRYYRMTSISVSDYLTDSGISIQGPRRLSCRGFRRFKPPPLRASLSLSEARVTAFKDLNLMINKSIFLKDRN